MANRKPKAERIPKATPPPDKSEQAENSQRERFIEAARDAGVTDEAFDKALTRVAPPKPKR
jgi:hypothetical protein